MFHLELPITDPTWIFFVVLSVILFAPMLLERLRIPSIIGLITAGVLIGPHGIHLLDRDSSFEIFGKVGLLYIMFLASLEMNIQDVMKQRNQAVVYGIVSFLIPIGIGFVCNHWILGYVTPAALLMASMYAAHTLITYPTVMKMGITKHRAVNIAVGGTIVAVTLTLILLAVVGGVFKQGNGDFALWILLLKVAVLSSVIIFVFPVVARRFFRRYGDSVLQYIFVLGLVFLGGGLMEMVGMEGILGAFLVGLVLNREIPPGGPLMSHIEFLGNALFIPYFLIGVGMMINVSAFGQLGVITVAVVMILCGTVGKWLAALVFQKIYGFNGAERRLMFGLSSARAAATLAIVLVGYEIILPDGSHLLGDEVLNAAMFLILASCVVSSLVTEDASRRIVLSGGTAPLKMDQEKHDNILVALNNPKSVVPMTNLALMLRTPTATGALTAINVILDDDPETRDRGQKNLEYAAKITAAANVKMQTHCRWSVNPVTGISHAAKEYDASDILVGLHQKEKLTDNFFGRFTEELVATVSQQVLVYRAVVPIYTVRRIHVVAPPKGQLDPGFSLWVHRMATLAQQICSRLTIYGSRSTLETLRQVWKEKKYAAEVDLQYYHEWDDFVEIADRMRSDHLAVFVLAQKGTPWRHAYHNHIPEQIERYFSARSVMCIVPAHAGAGTGTAEVRAGIAIEQR